MRVYVGAWRAGRGGWDRDVVSNAVSGAERGRAGRVGRIWEVFVRRWRF
jgi:hypothetical protein